MDRNQSADVAQVELRRAERFLRSLHELAMNPEGMLADEVRALLDLGRREFGFSLGMMTQAEGQQFRILEIVGDAGPFVVGNACNNSESFCGVTMAAGRPIGIDHAGASDWRHTAAYRLIGMESYLGTPTRVGHELTGTICFLDPNPRSKPLTPTDFEILRLLAQRVEAVLDLREVERRLRMVLEETSAVSAGSFFRAVVRQLAGAMDVRYAFVAESTGHAKDRIRTLAFWTGDDFAENFESSVAGTPSERVLEGQICNHPSGVRRNFPGNLDLERLGIESFLGIPILDTAGGVIGLLAAMGTEPMKTMWVRAWILKILASRAGAEMVRMRTEEALRESEDRFRTTFRDAQVGIAHIATDGRWIRVNNRLCEMLGYTQDDLQKLTFQDITHPEDLEANLVDLRGALSGKMDHYIREKRYIKKDGSIVWANLTANLLRHPSGEPKYFISVIEDITERKRAEKERRRFEAQVQHAQKLESLGVLAGGVAHDFNNLLTGILGNASLALSKLPADSPTRERIQQIEAASLRAADLTNQLLAYAGKGRFVVAPLNLTDLVGQMSHLLQTAVSKTATLRHRFDHALPAIEADATQIGQLVMNLITNASDALGDKNGDITLTTGTEGAQVYLEVSDSGDGMDEETRSKIFDPFFTTKFTGRGLGLAAVLGIVKGHDGTIHVESEPGRGTTVRVLFPSTENQVEKAPSVPDETDTWHRSGTILVVDDEAGVRDVAKFMLQSCGLTVLTASNGAEGVEIFAHSPEIDAVLLDMMMPEMDGATAFTKIHRIRPETPVILMSGYNEQEATRRFVGQGLAGFLQKPYRPADLFRKLREVLDASPEQDD